MYGSDAAGSGGGAADRGPGDMPRDGGGGGSGTPPDGKRGAPLALFALFALFR
jgi:hypothetical protein